MKTFLYFLLINFFVCSGFAKTSSSSSSATSAKPDKKITKSDSSLSATSVSQGSNFEFMIGALASQYNQTQKIGFLNPEQTFPGKNYGGYGFIYYRFIGLSAEYMDSIDEKFEDIAATLNLRVLGRSARSSYLSLQYGYRQRTSYLSSNKFKINQTFPAIEFQWAFARSFGLFGQYRLYGTSSDPLIGDSDGDEARAGLYFDLSRIRISGTYVMEKQNSVLFNYPSLYNRKGIRVGFQLYF